ncbi:MAG: hypothetical protein N2747_06630 [Chitinophagaceae bacterium]|nr:hypothetical protein [Chitinophagaceae bacterium]
MKKTGIFAAVITSLLLLSGFFIPATLTKTISVPYNMYKCGEQFNRVEKIVNWFLPFASHAENVKVDSVTRTLDNGLFRLKILESTLYKSTLEFSYKNKKKKITYTAITDTSTPNSSFITLTYKTNLAGKLFLKSKPEMFSEKSLDYLKEYMTDTRKFYGFEILRVKVEDTAFLFMRRTVPVSQKRAAMKKMFEELIEYARQKNAGYNGIRIFYSETSGDEITLFASIGVTSEVPGSGNIEYKRMPFGYNLLMTHFQGPFGEAQKAIKALEMFKKDHGLISMAIPFMKFLSDGYDFADEQYVQMKVYYPVY